MLWNYNEEYRDLFSNQIHRDILIVPHATTVTKVKGKPPEIKNKRPVFEWVPPNSTDGKWEPKKSGGEFVLDDMDWVIDNSVLVKEKFKYSYAINSDTNLTFSACNAAMVQFTIRNEKEYIEELDENGEGTGNYYWEQVIPNLYKQEFTKKDPDGNTRVVTGEVLSNAVIEVYMYFNGDSDTLIYLGMFTVEEDKLTNDGYERQITAYDFLAFFRDMDVFNWYEHLFSGINKLQNDFEDYTNSTGEEEKDPKKWDENWIREPREKWTIKEALEDLINNIAAYDLVVYDEVFDQKSGKYKTVQTLGNTVSNPNGYGRDDYPEGNGYSGFGMPIMLDEDIMTKGNKRYIPSEPGENEHERYGYMSILDLEFYKNPAVIKAGALSMGKFLEDIGLLAGRYPVIRIDRLDQNEYIDPDDIQPTSENPYPSKYNNYERCILTFKPLPSKEDDSKIKNISDAAFDNSEIAKGFQHDYYEVQDMLIVKFELTDNTEIEYKNLTKSQKVAAKTSQLQTLTVSNNIFASYLVTKSDDEEISKMIDKYKAIREKLFGKETKSGYVSYDALFNEGYTNIRNRCYTPYQLTTYADPVRECGDRILINFKDRITGEVTTFYSYILSRTMEGIQKMMDTYTATGTVKNPVFADYQNCMKSGTSLSNKAKELGYMTPYDLIEYMRNCGYRLLDEPTDCSANYIKATEYEDEQNENETLISTPCVELKWSDPPDITDWKPHPVTWEGTTIVRKENAAPKHRWDGKRVTYSTTRDQYKTTPYKDEDIKIGRTYYYGFFPYFTADDSVQDHPVRHYTFTKTIEVITDDFTIASTIDRITSEGSDATVYYTLVPPEVGQFTSIKLYGKFGENPECDNTDDIVMTIQDGTTEQVVQNLNEGTYYFCLVTADTNNEELSSNVESVEISAPIVDNFLLNVDFTNNGIDKKHYNPNDQMIYGITDVFDDEGSGSATQWIILDPLKCSGACLTAYRPYSYEITLVYDCGTFANGEYTYSSNSSLRFEINNLTNNKIILPQTCDLWIETQIYFVNNPSSSVTPNNFGISLEAWDILPAGNTFDQYGPYSYPLLMKMQSGAMTYGEHNGMLLFYPFTQTTSTGDQYGAYFYKGYTRNEASESGYNAATDVNLKRSIEYNTWYDIKIRVGIVNNYYDRMEIYQDDELVGKYDINSQSNDKLKALSTSIWDSLVSYNMLFNAFTLRNIGAGTKIKKFEISYNENIKSTLLWSNVRKRYNATFMNSTNYDTSINSGGAWTVAGTKMTIGRGNTNYGLIMFKTKILKLNAKNIYVTPYGYSGSSSGCNIQVVFLKELLTDISQLEDPEYVYTNATYEFVDSGSRTVSQKEIVVPLENVTGGFYLAFYSYKINTTIYAAEFDDQVEFSS